MADKERKIVMGKKAQLNDEIISQIYFVRGRKVMLDSDLARIYGVETRKLNQAVKRNIDRFPADFMFQISYEEFVNLMSQIVISSSQTTGNTDDSDLMSQIVASDWGGRRKLPLVFSEHGALMLASVLNSPVAVKACIYMVRAFVKLREILSMHQELSERINDLEKRTCEKLDEHSEQLILVFQALRELVRQKDEPRTPIGFKIEKKTNN
jgi:hypothetical protein